MEVLIFAAIFWVAPIFVGHKLGAPKNRAGWAWGLLLGWIGVIIVACLSAKHPQPTAADVALTSDKLKIEALETEIRLAELNARKEALQRA
jgi:threonine/homoserine efflux transporter RhtA